MQDKEAALFFASSKADDVELMAKLVSKRPELVIERDQHLGVSSLLDEHLLKPPVLFTPGVERNSAFC